MIENNSEALNTFMKCLRKEMNATRLILVKAVNS